ncbi:MAG: response regulator [Acidobacteriota bacterium]|nr:response regulator [Acidobacteriota bacterium]
MHGTILLIDDSRLVQKLYHHKLLLGSYKALIAGTGEEGLEILANNHVDLILLDLGLPTIDGLEVLKRIKANSAFSDIPVIVFSAKEQESLVEQVVALGADKYLVKATSKADDVVATIRSVLAEKRSHRSDTHFRLGIDPVSLDAHTLAESLGLDRLACRECGGSLLVDLSPSGTDEERPLA